MATCAIPLIDPDVKFVGVSKLRDLNATKLKDSQETTYVLQENDQPLAVLLSYERYLIMQRQFASIMSAVELLANQSERDSLLAGLKDVKAGGSRSFEEIRAALKDRYATTTEKSHEK
jgi:PHD/YefM family antitoxin component YafN of YafNO toxin-antitoxin module